MEKEITHWIEVAVARRPHGIRGGFEWQLFNKEDSSLKVGMEVLLTPMGGPKGIQKEQIYVLEKISLGPNIPKNVAYLQGITTRDQVEAMVPYKISIREEELIEKEDDEYFLWEILKLKPVDSEGRVIGKFLEPYDNGAQVVLVIQIQGGKRLELPFVEVFFPRISIPEGVIEVVIPEEVDDR